MSVEKKIITSATVGSLTAYELRQELIRRNALDIEECKINFKSMLQRLMVELVLEETKVAEEKVLSSADEYKSQRELAKQQREERKREALERSRQRQADPKYFEVKVEQNLAKAVNVSETALIAEETLSDEIIDPTAGIDADPFRETYSKGNKIFVR